MNPKEREENKLLAIRAEAYKSGDTYKINKCRDLSKWSLH